MHAAAPPLIAVLSASLQPLAVYQPQFATRHWLGIMQMAACLYAVFSFPNKHFLPSNMLMSVCRHALVNMIREQLPAMQALRW